jgi:hypothetical protein
VSDKPIKLTHRQSEELIALARDPEHYCGGSCNLTMKALKKRGLVDIVWAYPVHRIEDMKHKWVVTPAGVEWFKAWRKKDNFLKWRKREALREAKP